MKIPLRYQISEYDCGPTSLLNAVSYLFEREEIPPELIRNIMLYSLDCYGKEGILGKNGTSRMAMMFLSGWLDGVGKAGILPIESRYLSGTEVHLREGGAVTEALRRGGVAVVRLFMEGEHYVLFTGIEGGRVFLFDPYCMPPEYRFVFECSDCDGCGLENGAFCVPEDTMSSMTAGIESTTAHPTEYNRIVPCACFDSEGKNPYALGTVKEREAVLIFNKRTKLTAERTIEYFI